MPGMLDNDEGEALADDVQEVLLPSARGRRSQAGLTVELVRCLTAEDLPALQASLPVTSKQAPLTEIRHSHHQLAQLLAQGREQETVSLITGYSPSYISNVQNDPLFQDLLVYYQTMREQIFVDVAERMKIAGLCSLEELQARLEASPEGWTKRELMEMAKLCLVDSGRQAATAGLPGSGPDVRVSVSFVAAASPVEPAGQHAVIEGELAR